MALVGAGALLGSFWLEWRHSSQPEGRTVRDVAAPSSELGFEYRPRVEVLNGAGDRGAAKKVASYLRERGFDIVYFGNASRFDVALTRVLDRSGQKSAAETIARTLGLDSAEVQLNSELYLDATVVLGSDWRERLLGPPR